MTNREQEIADLKARLGALENPGETANTHRKIDSQLGIGITLLPIIFVWLLLQPGYSSLARIVGFGWLGICALMFVSLTYSPAAAPIVSSVPSAVARPVAQRVLMDVGGSGMKSTELFTTQGDEWRLHYTYDCSGFSDGQGNFAVLVMTPGGRLSSNSMVNELGSGGSDSEAYHAGGTYFLEINSECRWHVTVYG